MSLFKLFFASYEQDLFELIGATSWKDLAEFLVFWTFVFVFVLFTMLMPAALFIFLFLARVL